MAAYCRVDDLRSPAGWLPVRGISSRPNARYRVWESLYPLPLLTKWCYNNRHYSEVAPHHGGNTAGIDIVWRNYVTVALCIKGCASVVAVDLYALYNCVQNLGGYDNVSICTLCVMRLPLISLLPINQPSLPANYNGVKHCCNTQILGWYLG